MSKLFEVPYNFAGDYVGRMSERLDLIKHIRFVYLPAWKEDGLNTRWSVQFAPDYPKSYDEYVMRIRLLQTLGLTVCILGQRKITYETIKKYYDIGIRDFILNNDELAVLMKKELEGVRIYLSITRNLFYADIASESNDFSMYDSIVLHHWFSRHISDVKKLPDKYKYTIIANSECFYGCKWGSSHWFATGDTLEEYHRNIQPAISRCAPYLTDVRNSALIEPENLHYFDPYVESYKLVDREWETGRIIGELQRYVERNPVMPRDEDFYNLP